MEERQSDRQTRVKKDQKDFVYELISEITGSYMDRVEYVIFLTILFCHLEDVETPNILSL